MSNVNITQILSQIEQSVITLAETTVSNYKNQAIQDGKDLLSAIKDDLVRWTNLLAQGSLTVEEFEFLVGSEKEVIEMNALEQAGLAAVRIASFAEGVLNVVIDTVLKMVIGNIPIPIPQINI